MHSQQGPKPTTEELNWIQSSPEFFDSYQKWKLNLLNNDQGISKLQADSSNYTMERIGLPSLYKQGPPSAALLIMKKQIVNQAKLEGVGKNSFRLSGDFFKYLKNLEDCNLELQKQLDSVVVKLEESQLNQIRTENSLKSHKEQTFDRMSLLIGEYKQAELEHQMQLQEMAQTIQVLQKELQEKTSPSLVSHAADTFNNNIGNNNMPPTVPATASLSSGIPLSNDISPTKSNPSSSPLKSSSSNDDQSKEIERLTYHLSAAEAQNAYLAALSDKTSQELQHKEVEMDQLWARIYDLHENLQVAYQSESAFQIQSIAIEELRSKLERDRLDPSVAKTYNFNSEQASMIENMLPSTSDRLIRTEEGWEWTPFFQSVKERALDVDFQGIMQELKDLKIHRKEAFERAKSRGVAMVTHLLQELGFNHNNNNNHLENNGQELIQDANDNQNEKEEI